jgi:formate hydrogenlyase subunit 3/multisubunit Na+/H+ antiporter MnhD subunit
LVSAFFFTGGMTAVVLAANAMVFLVFWEAMSLSSAALVVSDFKHHRAQHAAIVYLVATRVATALLGGGFLVIYSQAHSWQFSDWHFNTPQSWVAATLIMAGLCIKAGIWPFHIWLPYAHPEAPSPVSALMSAVMVKLPVLIMLRLFVLQDLNCLPLIYVLFALATISTFWGVLFAINQRELKRLLAYSTVENIGLILLALSVCIWAKTVGLMPIAELAFMAVLLHSLGHSLFKSLLFLCSGSVDYGAHSREFANLGGLSKAMPYTCTAFVIGSAAICALPPMNGFASKWYLYQSLLYCAFGNANPANRAICLITIGILSCVGALAIACFIKACGLAFLGRGRSRAAANAKEVPFSMLLSQLILAASCFATGVLTPQIVTFLTPILALSAVDVKLMPHCPVQFAQLALCLSAFIAIIYFVVFSKKPEKYITWDCGFDPLNPKMQATSDSLADPIARIFAPLLHYELVVDISGADRRHFPEKIRTEPHTVSLLENHIYKPIIAGINRLSRTLAKLQAGSIHLYLMYVCIALILLVFVGANVW